MVKKVVSVWGAPGSGKTVLTMALAAHLAAKHKNVIVLSTSTTCPMLPVLIPSLKTTGSGQSIGTLLSSKTINEQSLKGRLHPHPESDRIAIMGMCSGETPITYKAVERGQMIDLLAVLTRSAFDYVVFDCDSNPVFDQATIIGLETSDHVIRCITPDIKGIEFEKSQCMWMKNGSNFRIEQHIRVCSPVTESDPLDELEAISGKFLYSLPNAPEVRDAFNAGKLIKDFSLAPGIAYDMVVKQLTEAIE